MSQRFYSHGKLLLTAEYIVLDGATALAIPCKFGQDLVVTPTTSAFIKWEAYSELNKLWSTFSFPLSALKGPLIKGINNPKDQLLQILQIAKSLNTDFLKGSTGESISTHLEFPIDWGLGSSSSLINNIAQWSGVNPFELLEKSMGGSGYDIACAAANNPIRFKRDLNGFEPIITKLELASSITDQIRFVYLNKKQNSREGIQAYKKQKDKKPLAWREALEGLEKLSNAMAICSSIDIYIEQVQLHESLLSKLLEITPAKNLYFSDFEGSIKSLGAWGGDFIMAVSKNMSQGAMEKYFIQKGCATSLSYSDMIL
jgi:mevalonate kinase